MANTATQSSAPPLVGDRVLIEGTGRWWSGSRFVAVIADVDEATGTIKVKYADGGYKRFKTCEFNRLVAFAADFHKEEEDDRETTLSPEEAITGATAGATPQERQLTRRLSSARGKQQAGSLDELRRQRERLRLEQEALSDAVRRRDFLQAHSIDSRIRLIEDALGLDRQQAAASQEAASVMRESLRRALGGGVAGAGAMAVQVVSLMWLRTTLYYQYRYGSSTMQALRALYAQGGVPRFYQGLLPALLQGPLSRFGDTAANAGVLSLLDADERTRTLPTGIKSLASASVATAWRVTLMPLDTLKTFLQVEGPTGLVALKQKVSKGGLGVLYHGSMGLCASAFLGHYTWYGVYNAADARCPTYTDLLPTLVRNAAVGFGASAVSDTVTNSVRVVKTFRQTSSTNVGYTEAAMSIVKQDGVLGLFGRGLGTRLVANGIQAAMFSATWKYLQRRIEARQKAAAAK